MINFATQLKDCGCQLPVGAFYELLHKTRLERYEGWTEEDVLCEPRKALDYCAAVRAAVGCKGLTNGVILHALLNYRKRGYKAPRQKAGKAARAERDKTARNGHKPGCTFEQQLAEVIAKQPVGQCRVCGCTEADCTVCVERTGEPCEWVSPAQDLCSACLPLIETPLEQIRGGDVDGEGLRHHGCHLSKHAWDRLATAGFRCVGSIHGKPNLVTGSQSLAARGLLTKAQAAKLIAAVDAWLKDQLARDTEGNELKPDDRETFALPEDAARALGELDLPLKTNKKLLDACHALEMTTTVHLAAYVDEHDGGCVAALEALGLDDIEAEYVLGAMQTLAEEVV